jgi:hypothetical protein
LSRVVYQASSSFRFEIRAIEILGETEHFYTVHAPHLPGKKRREKKILSGWYAHSDTWEGVRQNMINHTKRKIEATKLELQRARSLLGELESMEKPKGA